MKVLVTGGSGFLGSHVVEQLIGQGHSVKCLVRPTSDLAFLATFPSIEFCVGSLEDAESLHAVVKEVDAVIHCAGAIKVKKSEEFYTTNVAGTRNLLTACVNHAVNLRRFVYISSLAAVGPSLHGELLSEEQTHHTAPVSAYGKSKRAAENLVLEFSDKLPVIILRPPMIYGPRDRETLIFFQLLSYGLLVLPMGGKNQLSAIYAADAANAAVKAMTADVPSASIYFISDGLQYSWVELQLMMIDAMQKKLVVKLFLPAWLMNLAARLSEWSALWRNQAVMLTRDKARELLQKYWLCNSRKAQEELVWQPDVSCQQGFALTYAWYIKNKWVRCRKIK